MTMVETLETWIVGLQDFYHNEMTEPERKRFIKKYDIDTEKADWEMVFGGEIDSDDVLIKEVLDSRPENYLLIYHEEGSGSFTIYELKINSVKRGETMND